MTDKELIRRFQRGEDRAFDELVKHHYPQSYQFFFRLVRDRMEADDLCQETYIRVYRGLGKFRFGSEFTTWLYRISANVANSYFRKRKIRNVVSGGGNPDQLATESDADPRLIPGLWRAIGMLPRKQRTVVILRIFQELTFKEVAGVLGMSENSAKVNFHYAVRNLKKLLGEI